MQKENQKNMGQHIGQLSKDAQELMAATADVAGEKVQQARQRLGEALEQAKEMGEEQMHKADQAIRQNPYPAIALAAGLGALMGVLMSRK